MSEYQEFLESKSFGDIESGHIVSGDINPALFDFQRVIVRWALARGRAAVFADTGLGKTPIQAVWADHVVRHTGGSVLIAAPLAVAHQTVKEAAKFDVSVEYSRAGTAGPITITNYEMFDKFNPDDYAGIVLDESSILKHQTSKTRTKLIRACQKIPYRLSCTATPSPNDYMELGNQAEFLGIMSQTEMLAMFFTHDGGETSKWRLKGHGEQKFWEWLSTWAVVVRKPSDLGFSDDQFQLPPLRIHEHIVRTDNPFDGELFPRVAETLNDQRRAQRASVNDRVAEVAGLVNASDDTWLVWCHLNEESEKLATAIGDAEEVRGSDSLEDKESRLDRFSDSELGVLVSKPTICGFGMNWQHCHKIAFVGLSHSFEQFYQAVRRCWRFGQTQPVDVHIFTAETEGQVLANIRRKEQQHEEMSERMVEHMRDLQKRKVVGAVVEKAEHKTRETQGEGWLLYLGDCVDVVNEMPDSFIDYTIFSPPFASLYTYSNSDRDMGNCKDYSEFAEHFRFLVPQLLRATKPGRLLSFHCMNLPTSKQNDGFIGIRDFRGDLIRLFVEAGWIYHSEVVIWKDPVTAMQRTKALGLLHKQLKKDSCMSRQGIPDYLVTMRKPGDNPDRVTHTNESFPVERWQRYASPIWMDINPSNTLQFRSAREDNDERHICPLQLEVIQRAVELWTNPGDLVLSPFAGIGSEGHVAIQMGRKFVGVELKESYWSLAAKNLQAARQIQGGLFA